MPPRTLALFLAASGATAAEKPSLPALMQQAGQYVLAFEQDASGVVLEESYEQSMRRGARVESRRLVSEFVLVTLPGETGIFGFRDGGGESLTATARYAKPRRFGVTTEERVGTPP